MKLSAQVFVTLAALLLSGPVWSNSELVLDQSFEATAGWYHPVNICDTTACLHPRVYLAQTFTAGRSGNVVAVSVHVTLWWPAARISIYGTDLGSPGTSPLATATINTHKNLGTIVFLDNPAPVTAGSQYALVFTLVDAPDADFLGKGGWHGVTAGGYPGGRTWTGHVDSSGLHWVVTSNNGDFRFKTWMDTIAIQIDIEPSSERNPISLAGQGVIPVAILTTDDFDALELDASTIAFGPSGAPIAHARAHVEDVDSDGDMDLLVHFQVQGTGIQAGDTEACLTAETLNGVPIESCDSVTIVPPTDF